MSCHICGEAEAKGMKRHFQNIGYGGEKWCGGCHSMFRYHFGGYDNISGRAGASGRMHYVDGMDSRVVTAAAGSNWQGTCSRAKPCSKCASVLSNWRSPSNLGAAHDFDYKYRIKATQVDCTSNDDYMKEIKGRGN